MGDKSLIEWTDATWNPTRGCSLKSAGCRNCYAMRFAYRFSGPGKPYEGLVRMTADGPKWTGKVVAAEDKLLEPLGWKRPRFVFVDSMSDLFHKSLPSTVIDDVFAVMAMCPQHTFQVLTKRPDRAKQWAYLVRDGLETARRVGLRALDLTLQLTASGQLPKRAGHGRIDRDGSAVPWPLPNVWLGTSIETQDTADERLQPLLDTPAAVRFISAEPLIAQVDFAFRNWAYVERDDCRVDWIIVGGESGDGARPMRPDWARLIRDDCQVAGIPFFFKQWGDWARADQSESAPEHRVVIDHFFGDDEPYGLVGKRYAGRKLDGREWNERPAGMGTEL